VKHTSLAQQKVIQAENAAALAATRSAELENEVASAKEQVLLYERDIANIKKIEAEAGARGVAAYAEQNALYTRDAKGNVARAARASVGWAEPRLRRSRRRTRRGRRRPSRRRACARSGRSRRGSRHCPADCAKSAPPVTPSSAD
jgi:hypothetical protein